MPVRSAEETVVVSVRMPRPLKERLHQLARLNRRSLNQQIVWALERWLEEEEQKIADEQSER